MPWPALGWGKDLGKGNLLGRGDQMIGDWLAGLQTASGKSVICVRFQQIASEIIEQH